MEIDQEIIKSIDNDLRAYEDYLLDLSKKIRTSQVTKYPIFVLHQENILELGKTIIDAARSKTKWSVNVSHLEDFVNRKIIEQDKIDSFRSVFKNPDEFCCIFILTNKFSNFVFRPYTTSNLSND